jgi:hypothetical protein
VTKRPKKWKGSGADRTWIYYNALEIFNAIQGSSVCFCATFFSFFEFQCAPSLHESTLRRSNVWPGAVVDFLTTYWQSSVLLIDRGYMYPLLWKLKVHFTGRGNRMCIHATRMRLYALWLLQLLFVKIFYCICGCIQNSVGGLVLGGGGGIQKRAYTESQYNMMNRLIAK